MRDLPMNYVEKLENLLIAEREFNGVTLIEAIEFLRSEAWRVDVDEPAPYRRGIQLGCLLLPAEARSIRINATLHDANLGSALRTVAEAAGLSLQIHEGGVAMLPSRVLDLLS